MLINPYEKQVPTFHGTRLLSVDLGVIGAVVRDPWRAERAWVVRGLYAPVNKRALGGIRVKLEDEKGFISFINQRDFEVLIGLGEPGKPCIWADQDYVGPKDNGWFGLCLDESDLVDDLFDREMALRAEIPGVLPSGLEIKRRIHISRGVDAEELLMILADADRDGFGPDPRIETIDYRWVRVERSKVRWDYLMS